MIPGHPSRGTRISRCLILGEDGISGGLSIVAGGSRLVIPGPPSRGTRISRCLILGEDGISGGLSIVAGGSRLVIPGPPLRGTRISRRLILGGLFCHDHSQRLHGGARNTERGDTELPWIFNKQKHGDDKDRYTHSRTLKH